MPDVVTFGETMALFTAEGIGPLRRAVTFRLGLAGAESNVAIALRRLGVSVAWCGRVGDDEFGRMIVERLRAEEVDASRATVSPTHPTGLMIKEQRAAGAWRVVYYRRGSAASTMTPDDLPRDDIASARVLHVTGITPALSPDAGETVREAIAVARRAGVVVSVDANYRSKLWGPDEAAPVLRDLVEHADVAFCAAAEASMITGADDPEAAAKSLATLGPREAIVKLGADGAVAYAEGRVVREPRLPVQEVDPVGAGDAFAAGYLTALVEGAPPSQRLRLANRLGAFAVTVDGDCDGLPTRAELDAFAPGEVAR